MTKIIKLETETISEIYEQALELLADMLEDDLSETINLKSKIDLTVNALIKSEIEKIITNKQHDLEFNSSEDMQKFIKESIDVNKRSFDQEIKRRNT